VLCTASHRGRGCEHPVHSRVLLSAMAWHFRATLCCRQHGVGSAARPTSASADACRATAAGGAPTFRSGFCSRACGRAAEQNDRMRRRREAMHIELGSFILEHFEMVIWPALDVKGICKLWRGRQRGRRRPFGPDRVRQLLFCIGHSDLLRRAKRMASQYRGKAVVEGSEFQSTLRCCICGTKNASFSGETFRCSNQKCNYTAHRDLQSAANTLLQWNIWST